MKVRGAFHTLYLVINKMSRKDNGFFPPVRKRMIFDALAPQKKALNKKRLSHFSRIFRVLLDPAVVLYYSAAKTLIFFRNLPKRSNVTLPSILANNV